MLQGFVIWQFERDKMFEVLNKKFWTNPQYEEYFSDVFLPLPTYLEDHKYYEEEEDVK